MLYKERMTNHIYLPVIVLLIGGAGFAVGPLALAWLWARKFSPQKSGPSKNAIYECGLESVGDAWIKFKPGYYIYAIVFLIFDVEAVFLLPFAVAFGGFTAGEAIEMLVFVILLVGGLIWACQKDVLSWS
jgi:NADH:ubiquinone oxidoreductase subunit 3 (subunit A)